MNTQLTAAPHSLDGVGGDRLVNEKVFSGLVGRSVSILRKDRMAGCGFPFIKLGRSIRYSLADAREEISRQRRSSTTDIGGAT